MDWELSARFFPRPVCVADSEWVIRLVNREPPGFDRAHLVGQRVFDILAPESRARVERQASVIAQTGCGEPFFAAVAPASGRSCWVELTPLLEGHELRGVTLTWPEPRTEALRDAEAANRRPIDDLASSVASELSRLLNVIRSCASFAKLRSGRTAMTSRHLDALLDAADRAGVLTRELAAFSRQGSDEPGIVGFSRLVVELDALLSWRASETEVVTILDFDVWPVQISLNAAEQLLLGLLGEALEAAGRGGRVEVSTRNATLRAPRAGDLLSLPAGEYVQIAVTATSSASATSRRESADASLVSAPRSGPAAAGATLTALSELVERHGGQLLTYGMARRGVAYKIYLPRATEAGGVAVAPDICDEELRGSETVLVAEDQPTVRELLVMHLSECGYRVLHAEDGGVALRVADEHDGRIDLLIADVVMPVATGAELATRLAVRHPETKILYISGFPEQAVRPRLEGAYGDGFLQKPFRTEALLRKIRQVLDTSKPSAKAAR